MRYGNNVREFRRARGLSVGDLARAVGMDRSYLSRVEREKQTCSDQYKVALAQYFGVSVTRLFFQEIGALEVPLAGPRDGAGSGGRGRGGVDPRPRGPRGRGGPEMTSSSVTGPAAETRPATGRCEWCGRHDGTCEWCGVVGPTHVNSYYIGGRGFTTVQHCHDLQACERRRERR